MIELAIFGLIVICGLLMWLIWSYQKKYEAQIEKERRYAEKIKGHRQADGVITGNRLGGSGDDPIDGLRSEKF